jgi:hypothetical protein
MSVGENVPTDTEPPILMYVACLNRVHVNNNVERDLKLWLCVINVFDMTKT